MKVHLNPILVIIIALAMVNSCENRKANNKDSEMKTEQDEEIRVARPGPPAIIYKTKANYFDKVPVTLSDDKRSISSFPDIRDVYINGQYTYPTRLKDGFLLDNRGISGNVGFLRLTYGEYSKLEKTPTASEIMEMILDDDPLVEMYDCGLRSDYRDIEAELNDLIGEGDFSSLKKLR